MLWPLTGAVADLVFTLKDKAVPDNLNSRAVGAERRPCIVVGREVDRLEVTKHMLEHFCALDRLQADAALVASLNNL